jgi:hypothetical protein
MFRWPVIAWRFRHCWGASFEFASWNGKSLVLPNSMPASSLMPIQAAIREKDSRQINMLEHVPAAKPLHTLAGHSPVSGSVLMGQPDQGLGGDSPGIKLGGHDLAASQPGAMRHSRRRKMPRVRPGVYFEGE